MLAAGVLLGILYMVVNAYFRITMGNPVSLYPNNKILGGAHNKAIDHTFRKHLEDDLRKVYEHFKDPANFDITTPDHMKKTFFSAKGNPQPLVCFEIKDGKCIMDDDGKNIKDDRPIHTQLMFENTIAYAKRNGLKVPNTKMYVYISDRFPFENPEFVKFPIYLLAKPKNVKVPLLPDGTFEVLHVEQKYKGKSMNWDEVKDKILAENGKHKKRKDLMYFKGTNTTKRIHNMRQMLADFSKTSPVPIEIQLDAWKAFENVWDFNKYTHLLNLPGHYPWSNRFKYILLMDSIVINVDVRTVCSEPVYEDEEYVSFIDYIVKPGVHYVNIPYTYYDSFPPPERMELKEEAKKLTEKENEKLRNELVRIYEDSVKNPKKYEKMKQAAIETVSKLTMDEMYHYLYTAICLNADLLNSNS
jgi:hypothetical protein